MWSLVCKTLSIEWLCCFEYHSKFWIHDKIDVIFISLSKNFKRDLLLWYFQTFLTRNEESEVIFPPDTSDTVWITPLVYFVERY